ncbi:MAG: ADP-ribosylglycohydrolase family protein [Armatimonadota bacterium]|nr:ADP-ribosylglycohydrolase family protein [Armatimonadota bacterium]
MRHAWLYLSNGDVETERQQCDEEGKDITPFLDDFAEVLALDLNDRKNWPAAEALFDQMARLRAKPGYPFIEPSDLGGIKKARVDRPELPSLSLNNDQLYDRVYGAWLGRCSGCLLGKPVEGWRRDRMTPYLEEFGYPLTDYIGKNLSEEQREKHRLKKTWDWDRMPEDDDTNYTTIGLAILERHGAGFSPVDIANFWMSNVPILHTCTAERAAYRNLVMLIPPPESASFRNPYREWIGAQIRADAFGYACPRNPELAAEFAWRDASISHVKNGIYGEMFVAAMLAAAYVTDNVETIIRAGIGEIPEKSRLRDGILRVLRWHNDGASYEDAVEKIHEEWNEQRSHDWCHTISNAMIVAIGLLWGDLDYEKSITRAVMPCFDTDCNGATVGSIVGTVLGASKLPVKWTGVINDTLETGVAGYNLVKISDMAKKTMGVIEAVKAYGS